MEIVVLPDVARLLSMARSRLMSGAVDPNVEEQEPVFGTPELWR